MLTKKIYTLFFFNNIFTYIIPPTHPTLPCDGFGKFFGRLFLKTIFFTTPPIQNIFINFYFYPHPRCATGRENFLYRTFCGKIFVSSPTKNYTLTPVSISNIKSFINSQEKKSKLYPHGTLYPLYLTAKHRTGFNPLLCRYMLSLL